MLVTDRPPLTISLCRALTFSPVIDLARPRYFSLSCRPWHGFSTRPRERLTVHPACASHDDHTPSASVGATCAILLYALCSCLGLDAAHRPADLDGDAPCPCRRLVSAAVAVVADLTILSLLTTSLMLICRGCETVWAPFLLLSRAPSYGMDSSTTHLLALLDTLDKPT